MSLTELVRDTKVVFSSDPARAQATFVAAPTPARLASTLSTSQATSSISLRAASTIGADQRIDRQAHSE
jgi:hypothetical protein